MTVLYLQPHPLGVVVRTILDTRERDVLSDVSELICEGDVFGGLTFERLRNLAGVSGGKIDANQLAVD